MLYARRQPKDPKPSASRVRLGVFILNCQATKAGARAEACLSKEKVNPTPTPKISLGTLTFIPSKKKKRRGRLIQFSNSPPAPTAPRLRGLSL